MKIVSGLCKALAITVALAASLAVAVRLLTSFGPWDDEGYMLVSLAHYVNVGHLYTQTFSQYGPFYFYAQGIFFQLLRLPVTHDMGRLVTLIYWLAASLLAAVFVQRTCKSVYLASAAGLCSMLAGLVLTNEPDHPQEVLLLLFMVAACLSAPWRSGRLPLRLFLLGCVGAALAFTKVNVGVFFIAGLAQAVVCVLPRGKIRFLGIGFSSIYAAAFPWVLMHAGFDRGFRGYCIVAAVSGIVTLAYGMLFRPNDPLPMRAALWPGAGLLAGTGLIVIATSLQGMTVSALVFGVILNPLHHPKAFDMPLFIGRLHLLAMLALAAGVVVVTFFGRRLGEARWFDVLRCAVGIVSIFLLTLPSGAMLMQPLKVDDPLSILVDSSVHRIEWVAPLLALALVPQPHWKRNAEAMFPRLFITFMAATQFLQPYPVAGSQMGIAAAPMILWAFLMIGDGIAGLRAASREVAGESRKGLWLDALLGGAILVVLAGLCIDLSLHSQFPPAPTKLRGSTWMHLPPEQTARYEAIVSGVRANCDVLFSMPGLYSFNMWSGIATPNGWNLTAWMKGLNVDRQAEILNILKADSRACTIVNSNLVHFWDRDEDEASVDALPLVHYIKTEMPKVAEFGGYEVHVHPQRSAPWQ